MNDARQQAIEYRRQLLRIVDQIERDYGLGKHAPEFKFERESEPGTAPNLSRVWHGGVMKIVDTQPK